MKKLVAKINARRAQRATDKGLPPPKREVKPWQLYFALSTLGFLALVVGVVGASGGTETPADEPVAAVTPEPSTSKTQALAPATTAPAPATTQTPPPVTSAPSPADTRAQVPNVVGMTGDNARDALTAVGIAAPTFQSDDGSGVWAPANWKVTAQSVAAGTRIDAGAAPAVTLTVTHVTTTPTTPASTPFIDAQDAAGAADYYVGQYVATRGYKWNGSPNFGFLGGNQTGPNTWWVKYEGTIKNAAGGKVSTNVEATVTGTLDNYTVTNIIIYAFQ